MSGRAAQQCICKRAVLCNTQVVYAGFWRCLGEKDDRAVMHFATAAGQGSTWHMAGGFVAHVLIMLTDVVCVSCTCPIDRQL